MTRNRSVTGWIVCGLLAGCSSAGTRGDIEEGTTTSASMAEPVVTATVRTPSLPNYEDAPRTPDTDDPAIWAPADGSAPLVLATLKNAGLQVYDLDGRVLQTVLPPRRPAIAATDPIAPGPRVEESTGACTESESGETFGRFNNVDVLYGVRLGRGKRERKVDVAVVTDRGCDRVRFYVIDPRAEGGPLVDVTADDAPRVFPSRFEQPWALLDPEAKPRVVANPLDDQSTAYGITASRGGREPRLFVTQRSRTVVAELAVVATDEGTLTYGTRHEYRFPAAFSLGREGLRWTPCREDAADDPQLEGLVVDEEEGVLYAAQEVVGLWRVRLSRSRERVVDVRPESLFEPVRTFGAPYWAQPDDDEFECVYNPSGDAPKDALVSPGDLAAGGAHLNADVEGLAIHAGRRGRTLIVSSQGDDTFHAFDLGAVRGSDHGGAGRGVYRGVFRIEGVGATDGHAVAAGNVGRGFPAGLFAVQNGKAPPPGETPVNDAPSYDHSTRLELVPWPRISRAFSPPLPL